jgi:hypothetical protein
MTWQEAVRRAAEGGCPLLTTKGTGRSYILQYDPADESFWDQNIDEDALAPLVRNLYQQTAVLLALAWWWDKWWECDLDSARLRIPNDAIDALRARRAELEKEAGR